MIRRRLPALLLFLSLLGGCLASPNPTLYTLAPVQGTPLQGVAPKTVGLRSVSLARYLERPQIVLSSTGYQLMLADNDWWGEPLGAMLNRVLVEELSQRLPGSSVLAEAGAITAMPEATVEVNLLRLDADQDGTVVLRAQYGITPARGPGLTRDVEIRVPPPSPGIRGQVAARSVAVGQLADRIAASLAGR
ncbi:Membrane integrity-associated transporter subunit PqiC [Rhodovastum atsumiense]|uniref:Membrane integrity-associated transporter subunit PqiC n=1 Tax=Rhodovastum atsumiense TaxID=504468 RepID=A0A5M6IP40_9PROT|nr:PqiC family protein [Rhodovastum atsumiense]KAA5610030.1 membrane integrity-associated transporter subunit PqiC [Rhodovastum atsumiense]CAH2602984.1 Membrane integrity-associated transporter subunit PqiC [Rhodovastum atsumiense]